MIGGRRVIDCTVPNSPCRRSAEQDVVDSAARPARNLRPAAACEIEAVRLDRLQLADDAPVVALRADGVAAEGVDAQLLAGSVVRLAAGVEVAAENEATNACRAPQLLLQMATNQRHLLEAQRMTAVTMRSVQMRVEDVQRVALVGVKVQQRR